jgi:predicted GNAT family acetyltransferase
MNISAKENPSEFNHFLFTRIKLDQFQYKFLRHSLQLVKNGNETFYDTSFINENEEGGWILILHGAGLLIYGENWTIQQFSEIKRIFNHESYTNFLLSGDSEIIRNLIDTYEISNCQIEKERVFYRASKIKHFSPEKTIIENGSLSDLVELAEMLKQYYYEEYNGQNNKLIEESSKLVMDLISSDSIYVLRAEDKSIISLCTIINPDIGILFTKEEHRRKGNGKVLLSFCSKLLLQENNEVFLMTDRQSESSNTVCKKVGFRAFFNYTYTRINNT